MRGEELPATVHQHRMQLRRQCAAGRHAEVAPDAVEDRQERPVEAALVDPHPALRDLTSVPHRRVEQVSSPTP